MPRIMIVIAVLVVAMVGGEFILQAAESTSAPATEPTTAPALVPSSRATATSASSTPKLSLSPVGTKAIDARHLAMAQEDINGGIAYFLRTQNSDGGWGKPVSMPAFTALVLKALLQHPDFNTSSPAVARGFESLLKNVQPNGGIYDPKMGQANYTTSLAVMALATAKDPRNKPVLDKAVAYLKGLQIVEGSTTATGEKVDRNSPFFGGASYGEQGRPDLSNLQFTVDALHEAGVPKDDPFFTNAVVFLNRVQNRSESNDQPWAKVVNDGGFVYSTARSGADIAGQSKADTMEVDGQLGLRSYGSMTYAGFKSMLYCGLAKDDPRVRSAYEWIRRYWRLDSNPNMPDAQSRQGLFYYYHVFAKALRAWGQDVIVDSRGIKHNWREELIETLHSQRRPDGAWVNSEPRWYENMPDLVTAYSVLALEETLGK